MWLVISNQNALLKCIAATELLNLFITLTTAGFAKSYLYSICIGLEWQCRLCKRHLDIRKESPYRWPSISIWNSLRTSYLPVNLYFPRLDPKYRRSENFALQLPFNHHLTTKQPSRAICISQVFDAFLIWAFPGHFALFYVFLYCLFSTVDSK